MENEEKAGLVIPSDAELRESVIKEYGFDEATESERIDKALARERTQREITSKAIESKIKHRTEAEDLRKRIPLEKPEDRKEDKKELSQDDMFAVFEAKISREDIPEVSDYAKLKGISVAEALKSPLVKTLLAEKAEQRKTAEATNTGSGRRSTQAEKPEQILERASRGELPEDEEGMAKLADARMEAKKAKK